MREKYPNTEIFLVRIFLYSNAGQYGPEITPCLDTFHAVKWLNIFPILLCVHFSRFHFFEIISRLFNTKREVERINLSQYFAAKMLSKQK